MSSHTTHMRARKPGRALILSKRLRRWPLEKDFSPLIPSSDIRAETRGVVSAVTEHYRLQIFAKWSHIDSRGGRVGLKCSKYRELWSRGEIDNHTPETKVRDERERERLEFRGFNVAESRNPSIIACSFCLWYVSMPHRHHNRRRLIGALCDADFLRRGNREIERKGPEKDEMKRNLWQGYQCGIRRKERNIKRPRANV